MIRAVTILLLSGSIWSTAQTTGSKAKTEPPKTFATPEEARDALVAEAAKGLDAVRQMFGTGSEQILRTGDAILDKNLLESFNEEAKEKTSLQPDPANPARMTLLLGNEEWPFAVPLVKSNGRWHFDVKEGKAEIARRIIGGNELDAIQICQGYVQAQQEYASVDRDGNGLHEYASRIVSSPGQKDGLYWPGNDSPVAESFALAVAEGYGTKKTPPREYHGYYFRILTGQGPNADGGARDYMVHDLMIGGFALLAWPVEYGVSGVKTFQVNQDGLVYEKDLGPSTATAAKSITRFNPDKTWALSPLVTSDPIN
jgi:hypothetical protein